jgi:hypothetical protein
LLSEPSPKPGLPRHPHDRSRIALWQRQTLAALLFQLGGVPFMAIAAALGHAPWAFVLVWAPLSLAFNGFVLVGLRQGYALRWRDPTLTFQQIAYATLSAVSCYAVLGPMRGPALAMECLALLFSIFALSAREVRRLTALAIGLYGLVMLVHSGLQPQRYPPGEELANSSSCSPCCRVLPAGRALERAARAQRPEGRTGARARTDWTSRPGAMSLPVS